MVLLDREARRPHLTQVASLKSLDSDWRSIEGIGIDKRVRNLLVLMCLILSYSLEGISATQERKADGPKGLGDFQRRHNRDDRGWGGRLGRGWDSTPRSQRSSRDRDNDAPSVRVPNVGWESTPRRNRDGESSTWGGAKDRTWDAPTPRVPRGGSPEDDGLFGVDTREWEEEQVRLDRDWYRGAEEGGVAGDEEHNPLSQYEDLTIIKEAEIATKARVRRDFPSFFADHADFQT